ncbi:MAG: asparagine synthase-related protein [Calditrichaceae bacterium]
MAGIFGYKFYDNDFDKSNVCECLLKHAQQNFPHLTSHKFIDSDRVGFGFAMPHDDACYLLKSDDENYYFQLFGQIILPDGLKLSAKNFQKDFLNPFLKSKKEFLIKLNGAFVFALYNKKTKTFTLVNDPFGNFSLYYFTDKSLTVFSSQLQAIKEIINDKQWDSQGLGQYLGLGFSMNGSTIYKNIRRLQPAEIVTLSQDQIHSETYYTPNYTADGDVKKETANIKSTVISAIDTQLKNNTSIGAAITGGFDSRVTWSIIKHLNGLDNVTAFTHGLPDSRDIKIAKELSTMLGITHQIKEFDNEFIEHLPDLWEPFVKMTEGQVPITAAHALDSWKFGQSHYQVLLDSHGGALYRRQYMKVAEKRIDDSKSFPEQFFKFVRSGLLKLNVLRDDIQQEAITQSLNGLNEYFDSIKHNKTKGDKADLFYIHQVSANKYSVAGNVQMNWLLLSHPFLNLDAFNAVQKIPERYRKNQSIYQYIINQTYPIMKQFWLENMGMSAPYYGFVYLRYIPMIYELLLQKSISKVSGSLYKALSVRHFVSDYDLFFRINFARVKEILLRPNNSFNELMDKAKVRNLITQVEHNPKYKLSSLSELITLKLFFDIFS